MIISKQTLADTMGIKLLTLLIVEFFLSIDFECYFIKQGQTFPTEKAHTQREMLL